MATGHGTHTASSTDSPNSPGHSVGPGTPAPVHSRKLAGRLGWALLALLLFAVGLAAVCESMGWPFLQQPLQRFLSNSLQREVSFDAPAGATTPQDRTFQVHLLGSVKLRVAHLRVAAPAWSNAPHLLQAQDVVLDMRYADLWAAHQGRPVQVRRLQAAGLDAQLERLSDGRASWQFGKPDQPQDAPAPRVGNLQVASGVIHYRDEPRAADVTIKLSLTDGPPPNAGAVAQPTTATQAQRQTLQAHAGGRFRDLPLQVALTTSGALPWIADEAVTTSQKAPLTVSATVGRATLAFDGTAVDLRHLSQLSGQFTLIGPSLAAVGDPVGVTLPTTAAFRAQGWVVKQGDVWNVVADDVTVGSSRLKGAFTYDRGRAVPLLAGRLGGSRLMLVDLGPALGGAVPSATPASAPATAPATAPAIAPASSAPAAPAVRPAVVATQANPGTVKNTLVKGPPPKMVKAPGKVLPNRPFDLGALSRMDADVLIDMAELALNTTLLEPLRPLRTHLRLSGGVLTLSNLEARTAQGRLYGSVSLDGRANQAQWRADLRIAGVRLEQWLHLKRPSPEAPAYITGVLSGRAQVTGQGRSTADLLASLDGNVHGELTQGSISHLLVEMAGLDLAQGLGLLIKGDDALPMTCAVTDLVAKNGQLRPRVMVVDTRDSTIWVDGSLSLAQESMDLRAVVSPKDFSPLTLRTPLLVQGTFSNPQVSIQKAPLGRKLGGALLLGLINPLASLLALLDPGDGASAQHDAQGCRALAQRGTAATTAPR